MNKSCVSYCTADSYHIDELSKTLRSHELDPKFYDDVIHIQYAENEGYSHAYIFPYGCVVFWGMGYEGSQFILDLVKKHSHLPVAQLAYDECSYRMGDETQIIEEEDEIILESDDPLIMLSLSYGLSQSVKLTVFEDSINLSLQKSKHLPEELARRGATSMPRRKLSRKIGALFAERHSINLHNELLDTPEFFWRRPKFESYYHMAADYLDITTRTNILNQRLSVLHELYEVLSDELKHIHSARLEWIIILLIVTEVVMMILSDVLKWF